MKLDNLIRTLSEDASPREPAFSTRAWPAAVIGAGLSCVALLLLMGVRPDMMTALATWRLPLKLLFATVLCVASAIAYRRSAEPEPMPKSYLIGLLVGLAVVIGGSVFELSTLSRSSWASSLIGGRPDLCLLAIPVLAAAPMMALVFAMRSGAPASPRLAGALTGLLAGSIGAAIYMVRCTDDSPLFVAVWYCLAIGGVGVVGTIIGAKAFRW